MIPLFMGASIKSPIAAPAVVPLGQPVVELGAGNGQLLFPVQVEGKWYYIWDRSGSWAADDADRAAHDVLDGIFNKDINGVANTAVINADGSYGTTDVYRYATINGVKLALPTANGGKTYPAGIDNAQPGTPATVGDASTYDELLAIWDTYNGAPPSWPAEIYWSATPSASGHASVNFYNGAVLNRADTSSVYVAVEVLSVPPPAAVVVPGQDVIDLGYYGGKLRWPVQVGGKWYYYWDKSGTGTADNADAVNHDLLDGIFNRDVNGVVNTTVANADGKYGTTDTYRYGTLNGVKLALPTLSGGLTIPGRTYAPATSASGYGSTINPTYDGMLAIWDASNGTGTSTPVRGVPPNWNPNDYWSATPAGAGHAMSTLSDGWVNHLEDFYSFCVALEVTAQ